MFISRCLLNVLWDHTLGFRELIVLWEYGTNPLMNLKLNVRLTGGAWWEKVVTGACGLPGSISLPFPLISLCFLVSCHETFFFFFSALLSCFEARCLWTETSTTCEPL